MIMNYQDPFTKIYVLRFLTIKSESVIELTVITKYIAADSPAADTKQAAVHIYGIHMYVHMHTTHRVCKLS